MLPSPQLLVSVSQRGGNHPVDELSRLPAGKLLVPPHPKLHKPQAGRMEGRWAGLLCRRQGPKKKWTPQFSPFKRGSPGSGWVGRSVVQIPPPLLKDVCVEPFDWKSITDKYSVLLENGKSIIQFSMFVRHFMSSVALPEAQAGWEAHRSDL